MKGRKSSQADAPPQRIFIGVAGGSAAGKTTLCNTINRQMAFDRNFKVETISLDSFYKSIDKTQVDVSQYNFDHPLALDFDLAYQVLTTLKHTNEPVAIPQYSFVEHQRLPEPTLINPANIILFEGLMAFHDERIRNMMTYKIFINCDDDIRLCRRIKRDVAERGRTIVGVLKQYNKFVKNAFRDFIYPTIAYADIVIPGHRNNRISVDFIVQHIKNMAKKMNLFEKASKTRVFLFGENQYYDKNASLDYKASVGYAQQSFLIFPTSDEHRRQIDFFMSSLMSQAFTQDYFEQVYIYQFMKIVRALLRQLFELKSYKSENVELISYFQVREKLSRPSNKNIKIIFIPFILSKYVEGILSVIKNLVKPNCTIIIVNLFCDMKFPKQVYNSNIQGLIFLNLLLIANKKRLLEVLTSNNINNNASQNYDWLYSNSDLVRKGMKFVSSELDVEYNPLTWKDYEEIINNSDEQVEVSQETGFKKKQKKNTIFTFPIREDTIWNEDKKGPIKQISILQQKHENLCGFHALHTLKQYPNIQNIRSQQKFLDNFKQFVEALVKDEGTNWLKKPMLNPLQRQDAIHLAGHQNIFPNKEISTLFISENYITSHFRDLQKLSQKCDLVKNGLAEEMFIIMGVYCHFFVIRLSHNEKQLMVEYLDSINTPIEDIMNQKISVPQPTAEDINKMKNLKTSMKVIRELFYTESKIQTILVKLRIDEIIGSYQESAKNERLKQWLMDEYPAPVIRNDLIIELEKIKAKDLGEEYLEKVRNWLKEEFVLRNIISKEEAQEILIQLEK